MTLRPRYDCARFTGVTRALTGNSGRRISPKIPTGQNDRRATAKTSGPFFCALNQTINPPRPSGRIVRARLARSNRKISAQRFRARKALENRQKTPKRNTAGNPSIDRRLPTTRLIGGLTRMPTSARLPFSFRKPTELGRGVKNQPCTRVSNPPTISRLFRHGDSLPRIARPTSCIRPRPVAMSGRVVEASFSQARSYSRKQNTGRVPDIPAIWPVRGPLVVSITDLANVVLLSKIRQHG
jgi:hypothetical protein